jgi:hypothetical protein
MRGEGDGCGETGFQTGFGERSTLQSTGEDGRGLTEDLGGGGRFRGCNK